MCRVIETTVDDRTIRVADIKEKYMQNIADSARECDYIDRVVLFGSGITEQCREDSDIDLAVFGNQPETKCLRAKSYIKFANDLSKDDRYQRYDVLYFKTGTKNNSVIMNDINNGEVLFVR